MFEGDRHCHTGTTTERVLAARAAPAEPDLAAARIPVAVRDVTAGETILWKPCKCFRIKVFALGEVLHSESKAVAAQTSV